MLMDIKRVFDILNILELNRNFKFSAKIKSRRSRSDPLGDPIFSFVRNFRHHEKFHFKDFGNFYILGYSIFYVYLYILGTQTRTRGPDPGPGPG